MKGKIRVTHVEDNSQAKLLGIEPDDVIISYNDTTVSSKKEFLRAVQDAKSEETVRVEIVIARNGAEIKFQASKWPLGIEFSEEIIAPSGRSESRVNYNSESRVNYKTDYGVARVVCYLGSFLGWLLVIGGVIVTAIVITGAPSFYGSLVAMLPGLGTAAVGFMMIMGSQVTRATVDNADHTRQILATLNRQ